MVFQTLGRLKEGLGRKTLEASTRRDFLKWTGFAGLCVFVSNFCSGCLTVWEALDIGARGAALGHYVDEEDKQRYFALSDFAGDQADREAMIGASRQQGLDAARGDYGDQNYSSQGNSNRFANVNVEVYTCNDENGNGELDKGERWKSSFLSGQARKEYSFKTKDTIFIVGNFINAQGMEGRIEVYDRYNNIVFRGGSVIIRSQKDMGWGWTTSPYTFSSGNIYQVILYLENKPIASSKFEVR